MPFLDWRRPFVSEINDQQNKWFSKEFWMLTAICCYHVWYILPVYSLMGTRCDGEPACALLCVISAISSLKICTQPSHIMVVVQQTLGCLMHHLAMCLKLWLWNSLPYCQVVSGMNMSQKPLLIQTGSRDHVEVSGLAWISGSTSLFKWAIIHLKQSVNFWGKS